MTRKGEFVLRQLADEYILIPYGTTTEKMNRVLTLSETAAFIMNRQVMPRLRRRLPDGLEKLMMCRRRTCRRM